MNYLGLFSSHSLALISDWLAETGELYVDIYLPHSGGSSTAYFISSLVDLKSLILQQSYPEIVISIFHKRQYSLRGIADEALLQQARKTIQDGDYYTIVSMDFVYPSFVAWRGEGRSHAEFRRDFAECLGENVGIGQEPFEVYSGEWFASHPEAVLQISLLRNKPVFKNQDSYQPYAERPEHYQWVVDLWQEAS